MNFIYCLCSESDFTFSFLEEYGHLYENRLHVANTACCTCDGGFISQGNIPSISPTAYPTHTSSPSDMPSLSPEFPSSIPSMFPTYSSEYPTVTQSPSHSPVSLQPEKSQSKGVAHKFVFISLIVVRMVGCF